jgi:hypothetical protein
MVRQRRGLLGVPSGRRALRWPAGASCVGSSATCGRRTVVEVLDVAVHCGGGLRRGFCGGVVVGGGRWGEVASDVWRSSVWWRRRRWASRICGVAACIPVGGDMGGGGLLLGVGVGGLPFPDEVPGKGLVA